MTPSGDSEVQYHGVVSPYPPQKIMAQATIQVVLSQFEEEGQSKGYKLP